MATTLYFTTGTANAITPSINIDWDSTAASGFVRRECDTTDAGTSSNQETTETTTVGENLCQVQYISSQTLGAQTISGTFSISSTQKVSATGATHFAYHIWVAKPDGTERGVLYSHVTEAANALASSYTAATDSGTFSSVVCSAGDYIVIEVGYDVYNTTSKTFGVQAGSGSVTFDTSITFGSAPTALAYTFTSSTFVKDFNAGVNVATYSGGVGGVTFTVDSGALPTGLSLDSSTGTITGTPTVAGTYSAVIKVANGLGSDTEALAYIIGRIGGGWTLVPKL